MFFLKTIYFKPAIANVDVFLSGFLSGCKIRSFQNEVSIFASIFRGA